MVSRIITRRRISLASFDTRSLQHTGDIALAVTRALARGSDGGAAAPLVYTDVASYAFISLPTWAGQAALALSALIAFAAFWRCAATLRWRTFAAPPLALLFAGVLATFVGFALGMVRAGEQYWFAHPEPTRAWCVLLALLAIVLALSADARRQKFRTGRRGGSFLVRRARLRRFAGAAGAFDPVRAAGRFCAAGALAAFAGGPRWRLGRR